MRVPKFEEQFTQNALNTLEPLVFLAVCMYAGSSIFICTLLSLVWACVLWLNYRHLLTVQHLVTSFVTTNVTTPLQSSCHQFQGNIWWCSYSMTCTE